MVSHVSPNYNWNTITLIWVLIQVITNTDTRIYLLNFHDIQLLQKSIPTLELNFHFIYNTHSQDLTSTMEKSRKEPLQTTEQKLIYSLLAFHISPNQNSQLQHHCSYFLVLNLRYHEHKHKHILKFMRNSMIAKANSNSNLRTEIPLRTQH